MSTVTALKERQAELKRRELELRQRFLAEAGDKKEQQSISTELRAVTAELTALSPQIAASKEASKVEALIGLLASQDYKRAVSTAASGLASTLEPWLDLISLTEAARKSGVKAPALPPIIGTLYVDGLAWLQAAVKRGSLNAAQLPAPLRHLMEGD